MGKSVRMYDFRMYDAEFMYDDVFTMYDLRIYNVWFANLQGMILECTICEFMYDFGGFIHLQGWLSRWL